jgi:hypothetical protein
LSGLRARNGVSSSQRRWKRLIVELKPLVAVENRHRGGQMIERFGVTAEWCGELLAQILLYRNVERQTGIAGQAS